MKRSITFLLVVGVTILRAQDTTRPAPITISAYSEVYYQYDFAKPSDHTRPPFVYSYNRTNEFSVNLALLKVAYVAERVRSTIALMTGTYANANLVNEPGVLKNVFEASIGTKLSRKKDLWLDAGVLPAHIGFESAIRKDCWTLTRSMLADNSPYYEAGIRMSYRSAGHQWYLALLLLNGWQRIERIEGNNTPAFGTQVTFTPTDALTINASTYIGNEFPDSISRWRYFHNFYTTWQISNVWALTMGCDAGMQQRAKRSNAFDPWYGLAFLVRCSPAGGWTLTGRWEQFKDRSGVIIPAVGNVSFNVQGASINVDRTIAKNLLWCLEGKVLWSADPFVLVNNLLLRSTSTISTGLCFSFN